MKKAYPIKLTLAKEGGYIVYVPDFDISTEGNDMVDAMFMARDAISMMGCYYEDKHQEIPEPSLISSMQVETGEVVTLVDVDFALYRKKNDTRAIRKNVTIPRWLNAEAEEAGINFSATLQNALKEQLRL